MSTVWTFIKTEVLSSVIKLRPSTAWLTSTEFFSSWDCLSYLKLYQLNLCIPT